MCDHQAEYHTCIFSSPVSNNFAVDVSFQAHCIAGQWIKCRQVSCRLQRKAICAWHCPRQMPHCRCNCTARNILRYSALKTTVRVRRTETQQTRLLPKSLLLNNHGWFAPDKRTCLPSNMNSQPFTASRLSGGVEL